MWTRYRLFLTVTVLLAAATSTPAQEAPAAPPMPDGWRVVSDETFPQADIAPIARKLGGEIAALRNTVYDVGGMRVQLNLIVTADEASAGSIHDALVAMKPAEFVLRQGSRIYEFVGTNEAIPAMRSGRAHLEQYHATGVTAPE